MLKFLFALAFSYIFVLVGLYFYQRNLIYYPDTSKAQKPDLAKFVQVTTSDGIKLEGWYFPQKDSDKKTIVLFHGNAGNLEARLHKAYPLLNAGYGVLLAEYRGYGGNEGRPSEQGFYNDGHAYMKYMIEQLKLDISSVVIYGESIGSGTATQMAMEYDAGALILEVPFDSLANVAQKNYFYLPVKFLLKDRFSNIDKISKINAPLLILHGHKDSVIPFSQAKKLYQAAKTPKKFVDFPQGNHTDLYNFGAAQHILDFLSGIESKKSDNSE